MCAYYASSHLLRSLDAVEEEANRIQLEKLKVDEENGALREQNFELQSRVRAAEEKTKKAQTEMMDKDKQLKIMTDQNSELLRLLETEEAQTAALDAQNTALMEELENLKVNRKFKKKLL